MSDEISVNVNRYGRGRNLMLRWTDPITGERKAKSAGTTDAKTAERLAGELEKQLRAGLSLCPGNITWAEFRQRYQDEKVSSLAERTLGTNGTAMNHLERVINPKKLASLTSATMSRFQASLRKEGMRDTSIAAYLRHLRAGLSWAVSVGMLAEVPEMHMPKRARGVTSRGRPLKLEEAERMLLVVPRVRPHDKAVWGHFLNGLWLSGLRLEEALALSWDDHAPFAVDLSGRRPRFRIFAEAEKAHRDRLLPMTPDFAEFLELTPEADRVGRVFKVDGLNTGQPMTSKRVSRIVSKIGRKAGVIVNGDGKAASAHDFRRSFGTRWAMRVRPPVLQALMRHASLETTLTHYVAVDADDIGDELWKAYDAAEPIGIGNTFGNIGENGPQERKTSDAEVSPQPVESFEVKKAEGKGLEPSTGFPAPDFES